MKGVSYDNRPKARPVFGGPLDGTERVGGKAGRNGSCWYPEMEDGGYCFYKYKSRLGGWEFQEYVSPERRIQMAEAAGARDAEEKRRDEEQRKRWAEIDRQSREAAARRAERRDKWNRAKQQSGSTAKAAVQAAEYALGKGADDTAVAILAAAIIPHLQSRMDTLLIDADDESDAVRGAPPPEGGTR